MSKLYIAVLDEVPSFMVPTLVAHSILGAHLRFNNNIYPTYEEWLANSFKKVVLKVNRKEFEKIKAMDNVYLGYENTTLNGEQSCAVVLPRAEYPNVIKFAKMYKI